MRVLIVHNAVADGALESDQDTLVQVEVVREAAVRLGHEVDVLPCTMDLDAFRASVLQRQPEVAFNLVESLGGSDRLQYIVPGVLDTMGIPYTGAPSDAVFLTVDKVLAKQCLRLAGLPTPDWMTLVPPAGLPAVSSRDSSNARGSARHGRYIIKTMTEHASFGIDDDLVFESSGEDDLKQRLREATARLGKPCLAEQFIEGREFNVSVLTRGRQDRASGAGAASVCEVLPPAEIDFSKFPAGKPRVVGYRAKWDADSFEFHHTPRTFEFPESDKPLLDRLVELSEQSWEVFRLAGHVRVDFRVDEDGNPWILEVNVSPCLSPDAGFAAALARAGIPFEQAIARILDDTGRTAG